MNAPNGCGPTWITKWSEIKDKTDYIVCPINQRHNGGGYYLGQPCMSEGWQVKQSFKEGCYAVLECPRFKYAG